MANAPEGKRFYGAITVSERGQVVIPVDARRDFNIEVGDKLLVMGDLEKGLWIVKASVLFEKAPDLFAILEAENIQPKEIKK